MPMRLWQVAALLICIVSFVVLLFVGVWWLLCVLACLMAVLLCTVFFPEGFF